MRPEAPRDGFLFSLIQINSLASVLAEAMASSRFWKLERMMSALELVVLVGIVGAFTTFAAVLGWASWAGSHHRAGPAKAGARNRQADQLAQIGRVKSA
jgi:hypothetical protein